MSARIISKKEVIISPWVRLLEKVVDFGRGDKDAVYHSISLSDYVSIFARTSSGKIPLVYQFRPAVEQETCELPAGLLEKGETPEDCCRRELKEEVGVDVLSMKYLGAHFPDSGRLSNRLHTFFVETSEPDPNFKPEPGLRIEFVTMTELKERIRSNRFPHLLHLGSLHLVDLYLERNA